MEIILRESDRLNRIITDFLNYARPRSITHSEVEVGELLKQTFTLLRYSPEIGEQQTIEEDIPEGTFLADADPEQLQQVFWNLARNALQAMPEGGTLRAELARTPTIVCASLFPTPAGAFTCSGRTSLRPSHQRPRNGLGLSIFIKSFASMVYNPRE